jgi:O-antigen/teichoic acid export membrane protein
MAPNLIILFRDWGVNSAMIKYTAQYASENKTANIKNIMVAGLIFELVLGFSLSFISFLLSGFLATNIFQRPEIAPLVQVASFTILAGALMAAAQSAFIGYEKMKLNSITLICQSALKTALAPLLVILGMGTFGAMLGTTIAFLTAGLISILILYLPLYRSLQGPNAHELNIIETIKTMFKYGLPLSISAILTGFLTQFYNFLAAIYCTDLLIGNFQIAVNFAVLITFFATPITTVLLPAFSKLKPQEETETLRNVFRFSVKYSILFVVPAAAVIMALSQPGISTLFGEEYAYAPLYLALIVIGYLYSAFGSLSVGNLLNSQGKTGIILILTLITSAMGLPLSILLIPRLGIIGLIITTLTAGIPSLIIGLRLTKKYYNATIDWTSSAKIVLASALAALVTYVISSQLSLPNWTKLIIGTLVFLAVFITTVSLMGTIDKTDIQNLEEMLKELGPLSHLFRPLLKIIQKLTPTRQRKDEQQNTKTTNNT